VLAGIRVLDLGRFIAAPYCGMLLADMGAEVARVERPGGEEDRRIGLTGPHGENFTYPTLARNKKGITLDLRSDAGRAVLRDLARQADVFLHNFGTVAASALGLGYDDIRTVRPDVIYAGISCYGSSGPYAHRTGFDPIAQVGSGAAALSGHDGDDPLRCGVPWVDFSTGLAAALGILLALRHRDRTGDGQMVDCALLQTAVGFTAPMIAEAVIGGIERPRLGNRAVHLGPTDLYKCRDGFVYIACATENAWRALMRLVGRPDLIDAPALRTHQGRFAERQAIDPLIADWVAPQTVDAVIRQLDEAQVPCGIYRSTADVPGDPQVRATGLLVEMSGTLLGTAPFRLSATPATIRTAAPRAGEHNAEVYRDWLGYSPTRLRELEQAHVV
jgi:crotonobetainyl-CoA:carnitine CoA-transferase CaiB-like acyl-CoA transferase